MLKSEIGEIRILIQWNWREVKLGELGFWFNESEERWNWGTKDLECLSLEGTFVFSFILGERNICFAFSLWGN